MAKNIAKKPKNRQGVFKRNDKKYEVPSTDKSDIYYGEVAKGKGKSSLQKEFKQGYGA